jgi:hypothetical protein
MPALTSHQSASTTKLLFIGDSGCLTGDTIVSVRRGVKPKKMTMVDLFHLFHGNHHNRRDCDTYLLADLGGYVRPHKMLDIVKSGKKTVFLLEAGGKYIKASADHKFSTIAGWKALSDLKVGDAVFTWRSRRDKAVRRRGSGRNGNDRPYIYSIPFHPTAMKNIVAGRDYKRNPRARLTVEAAMNGLDLQDFIQILRTDAKKAATLSYLSTSVDVHHQNGNYFDDSLDNLQVIDRLLHIQEHHEIKIKESKAIELDVISAITEIGEVETYDIMMDAPYHNFIANGFVVHNSGKTGALASLAAAGYNLRIIDLDNGLDVLANILSDPLSKYGKDALSRVNYVTITDKMRNVNGKLLPAQAQVWQKTMELMQKWEDLGPVTSWTSNEVLVIDSLTMLSTAAMNFALSLQGRLGQHPQLQDWGVAQNLLESFIQMLYDDSIKCNVIINCHIKYMGEENGPQRGYPNTLGQALPPKLGRYFNTILLAQSSGTGSSVKRQIWTNPRGVVELKNTAPTRVKPSYDLETGLAEYFKAVRGA